MASRTVAQVPSDPTSARATWKPFSGQQVIQVVSGDAARDVGILPADLLAVTIGQGLQARVDCGAASAFAKDAIEVAGARRADTHDVSAICENVERLDIVVSFAGHDRVDSTGVVADHAS